LHLVVILFPHINDDAGQNHIKQMLYFSLPPRSSRELRSSGSLRRK